MDRDRDGHGRARNARPRDRLGRPLPRTEAGVDPWPEDTVLTADQSLATAQHLLDSGMPFHAHEVLEAAWKTAPTPERRLWQGLAQLTVGVTHAARGNPAGARALLQRGRDSIADYADQPPHHLDVRRLLCWVEDCLSTLTTAGTGPVLLETARLHQC